MVPSKAWVQLPIFIATMAVSLAVCKLSSVNGVTFKSGYGVVRGR